MEVQELYHSSKGNKLVFSLSLSSVKDESGKKFFSNSSWLFHCALFTGSNKSKKQEFMKKRHIAILALALIFFGLPLIMWISWQATTPKPLSIFIMDKTSYNPQKIRNRAINWVLKQYRFVKVDGRQYDADSDYYGFFPVDNENFEIRDLSAYSRQEIQQLAVKYHMAYYVDSYGVYSNMWPVDRPDVIGAKKLYGGLQWEDILFLEMMHERNKMIIAEFIFLAPPTPPQHRKMAEEIMGVEWQGWTGRFFHSLDKNHPDAIIPAWLPTLYEAQYGEEWQFTNSGIILIHLDETLLVLEQREHLNNSSPAIRTDVANRREYGMSDRISYPGWFDITLPVHPDSEVISWYELDLTEKGEVMLQEYGIPVKFPAVIKGKKGGSTYYFAGDFGHNPLKRRFVMLKGARFLELFFADLNDPTDKSLFFLGFYLPMLRKILNEYQREFTSR